MAPSYHPPAVFQVYGSLSFTGSITPYEFDVDEELQVRLRQDLAFAAEVEFDRAFILGVRATGANSPSGNVRRRKLTRGSLGVDYRLDFPTEESAVYLENPTLTNFETYVREMGYDVSFLGSPEKNGDEGEVDTSDGTVSWSSLPIIVLGVAIGCIAVVGGICTTMLTLSRAKKKSRFAST